MTRKITRAATRIKLGLQDKLYLGNLEAKRDWGFAGDYVAAMWMMLQQDEPDDYVVATGETHSVREFAEKVFQKLDLDYKEYVDIDERYFRPTEVDILLGDSTKAREKLGWEPKVGFDELIDMMIDADMEHARKEKTLVEVYEMFPRLREREAQMAMTLSGGEQQMVAIARGLMAKPKILMLDEPSLGLAPILIKMIFETVRTIAELGTTVLIVEQDVKHSLGLSDRGYVLETGKIIVQGPAEDLLANQDVQRAYLGREKATE